MKYLKLFEADAEYQSFKRTNEFIKPNVSHCVQENEVHYNPHTFADEYFTTIARENGTISFNIRFDMGIDMISSISYSTDNGEFWFNVANENNKSENLTITVSVNEGDKVMWKGDATQTGCWSPNEDVEDVVGSFFSSTCEFDAQGNVMSLLYGDGFKGKTTIENDYAFACLFRDYDGEKACKMVNAKNLSLPAETLTDSCYYYMFSDCASLTAAPELPATTLAESCYSYMFEACTSLTAAPELPAATLANYCYQYMFFDCTSMATAPELPATTLAIYCYGGMFRGCTSLTAAPELPVTTLANGCYGGMFGGCASLTAAPELPATTLAERCYSSMFEGCTSLTTAPELPATTLADWCYYRMFQGCTNLTTAPELPATTLANYCYQYMFEGCTSLTAAPELPATTLAIYCYYNMFNGCTSLTTAPELPATTLTNGCYDHMFAGCTSLTTAPELPATTLTNSCYQYMFYGCTILNYIKCLAIDISATSCTINWVNGVASSGTFVKKRTAESASSNWERGVNGIPTGWTVENVS
jgi:hypothetical protein